MVLGPSLLVQYGLIGLLGGSYLMSLVIFPGVVEAMIPIFIGLGFNPFLVLVAASAGSVVGGATNYYLGFAGHRILGKFGYTESKFKKQEAWLDKWGIYSILILSFVPGFPFDFVAVLVGILRMDFKKFFIWMAIGKVLKYSLITFGTEAILYAFPVLGGL